MDNSSIDLEASKLAINMVKDLSMQLISLSMIITGLTITFAKDIKRKHTKIDLFLLISSWCTFIFSVLSGVFVLMKITGNLIPLYGNPSILINQDVRNVSTVQIGTFTAAILSFLIYGIRTLFTLRTSTDKTPL